jgi:hypothetical protein
MPFLRTPKKLLWTRHARLKMAYYRLSEQRVRRVLNAPKRIEEGVAPKTIAAMAPTALRAPRNAVVLSGTPQRIAEPSRKTPLFSKWDNRTNNQNSSRKETWSQEIWVMVQDVPTGRKIISAWRFPGVTKPRSESTKEILRGEYQDYAGKSPT